MSTKKRLDNGIEHEVHQYIQDLHRMHDNATVTCATCSASFRINEAHHCPTDIRAFEGTKYDGGKADYSLIPLELMNEVSKAYSFGEKKYGRYNYLLGMDWHRLGAAALRHTFAWLWGEDFDKESGVHHLGHAGACIGMLLAYHYRGLGKDTRFKAK